MPTAHPWTLPREWSPAFVEVLVPIDRWEEVRLWRQGEELPLYLKRLGGRPRILADWPRSGAGRYRIQLECLGETEERIVSVGPEKITSESYARLLEDLESRLPVSVAVGLQRTGALSGIAFRPPSETTLAEEANRLKRAVAGTAGRPGLSKVLVELARRPHVILRTTEPWVLRHEARRPHPARLVQAISLTGNLAADRLPERVLDTRVEHTADVYENRLVKSYVYQVELRLRRLIRALEASPSSSGAHAQVRDQERLLRELLWARRQAAFLDEVELLAHLPTRLTMVLRRRPPYRAALEGYLEFRGTPRCASRAEPRRPARELAFHLPDLGYSGGDLCPPERGERARLRDGPPAAGGPGCRRLLRQGIARRKPGTDAGPHRTRNSG